MRINNTNITVKRNKSKENKMKAKGYIGLGLGLLAGVVLLSTVGGSFYTIDQGEEGIILRNGAYVSTELPGFHTKTPFIDSVVHYSLRSNTYTWEGMESYSNDQQPAHIRVSVTIQPVPGMGNKVYSEYGGIDQYVTRVLNPRVPAVFKNVFGQFKAETAIKERARLNSDFLLAIKADVDENLVQIVSVQVEDIAFSADYIEAINQKQLATVEVQKRQQVLETERIQAQIVVTQAQAQADSQLAVATAGAKAIVLRGDAEAQAIEARGQALRDNPQLVNLITAEKWNGSLPTTMPPNGTVPFINVAPVANQ